MGRGSLITKPAKKRSATSSSSQASNANTCQALTIKSGAVKTTQAKTAKLVGQDNLSAILNEALNELVEECLQNPHKILVLNRMSKIKEYFEQKEAIQEDWLHPTLIRFDKVPKQFFIGLLLEYAAKKQFMPAWTEELLKKFDKKHSLKGIEALVCYLGHVSITDHIPNLCTYKPLLKAVLIARFEHIGAKVKIDSAGGGIDFSKEGIYTLAGLEGNKWTKIVHNKSKVSVDIPQDFCVTKDSWKLVANHSWEAAQLKGERVAIQILHLFEEKGLAEGIAYDKKKFLNDSAEAMAGNFPEVGHKPAVEQQRGALADADMGVKDPMAAANLGMCAYVDTPVKKLPPQKALPAGPGMHPALSGMVS